MISLNNIKNSRSLMVRGVLAIAAFTFSSVAGAEPLVTLKQMVEKTITSNPEVQAKYHAYVGAGYERDVVKGGFLPKVDVQSTYRNQEDMDNGISRANGTAIPEWNNELVLRQMIFDGFATSSEVKRLGHAQRVRYYELQSAMQSTTLEFMRSYLDTLRYRQLSDYAKTNFVTHKQLHDRIKERVDAGVARRVDLEQATGRLALAEANLLTEMTNLHDVTARMQRLLGELPPSTLEQPEFYASGAQATTSEALRVAYLKNPDLLSTIEDIQASKDEVKTKEAKYLPRLDLQARKNLGTSNDGRNSTSAADVLELTANFNLFNGFSDKAAISQTIEKLNVSNDLRDKACVDTRQIVSIAYNDIKQLKEQLTYRDTHQKSIENAREAYRKQFEIGQRTLLDLLDTENEYFQAKRAYTNTDYDIQTAYARLYAGQGELLSKIGTQRQGLPELNREAYVEGATVCEAIAAEQINIDKAALLADAKPLSIAPKPMPAPIPAVEKPKDVVVLSDKVVPDVEFETNSAKIKPVSYPVLDNAIKTLKAWGSSGVEVAGHTDKRNTSKADYNQKLSEKRAKSVSDYLAKHGIDASRLTVKGYGFDYPVAENDPIEGSKANRRVELIRQK
jgi:outer membrane protein, adhesin transport system